MSKKYIIYDSELTMLKWSVENDDQLLIFDTKESANRFIKAILEMPFYFWEDEDFYTTSVYGEVEYAVDCFNATNYIPVQNGDNVELRKVSE